MNTKTITLILPKASITSTTPWENELTNVLWPCGYYLDWLTAEAREVWPRRKIPDVVVRATEQAVIGPDGVMEAFTMGKTILVTNARLKKEMAKMKRLGTRRGEPYWQVDLSPTMKDILVHEFAHALGNHGHGRAWRRDYLILSRRVGNKPLSAAGWR